MAPWIPFWKYLGYWVYLALYFISCQQIWNYPPETFKSAIFKVLPLIHLMFVIVTAGIVDKGYYQYKWNVLYALMFSIVGDVLLVWRMTLFLPGLLAFALAHIFYIRAFQLKPFGRPQTAVSCAIIGFTSVAIILPSINEGPVMQVMMCLYSSIIFTLIWRSVVCYQTWPTRSTFCACAGAWFFGISDFMIAYDKWVNPIDGAAFYIHVFYFLAQIFITTSAACYEARPAVKQD